jgi:glycerol uptake facilitator-like aquaporin
MQGNLAAKNRKSLFFFEFLGTMFVTILYRILLQFLKLKLYAIIEIEGGQYATSILQTSARLPFFFAFWIVTLLTVRVSGAHYNPAISFTCMLKRNNSEYFPKSLGLLYIGAQFLGAFVGALLSWFLT